MHFHDIAATLRLGAPLHQARGVVILLHGRGSTADEISRLIKFFDTAELAYLVPEATKQAWYPNRFLAIPAHNEPWLSSALAVITDLITEATTAGIPHERIALTGFSQGACLSLEYTFRHPRRYAFIGGLSGALMGPVSNAREATDLHRTPILIGCAEADAHIPLDHVEASAATLTASNAAVTKLIFPGTTHGIFLEEAAWLKTQASALFASTPSVAV
jgi:predicted esterase